MLHPGFFLPWSRYYSDNAIKSIDGIKLETILISTININYSLVIIEFLVLSLVDAHLKGCYIHLTHGNYSQCENKFQNIEKCYFEKHYI